MTSVPPSYQHPGSPPLRPELPEGVAPPAPVGLPPVGVPIWAPFLVMLGAFLTALVVQMLVASAVEIGGGDVQSALESDAGVIGGTAVFDAALVALSVGAVTWLASRPSPATFGLRMPAWGPAVGWTLAAYATFWAAAVIVGLIFGDPDEQDLVVDLRAEDSLAVLAGYAAMVCLLAPLAEEFFFRGFLLRVMQEKTNAVIAIVVTGIAFGLVHLPSGDWIGVLILSFFGMALCALFVLTSSLLPCIMLHAFHNSISFGFTKELPWWGFLLLTVASVMTTFAIARFASRVRSAPA